MATVGQPLLAPEAGWRRVDSSSAEIASAYSTYWTTNPAYPAAYNSSYTYSSSPDTKLSFNFTGRKFRFLGLALNENYSDGVAVIDGISYPLIEHGTGSFAAQCLLLDKSDLEEGEHSVTIHSITMGLYFNVDAIDLDSTSIIKTYNPIPTPTISAPTNLTATAGDSRVSLSWTAVTGANGYNVKRFTTAGGPYTTIATNVTGTSYIDNTVNNGTTYYYVVTAVGSSGNESANSNEASATPQAPSGHGLLRITMNDSSEREYQLSHDQINKFIEWCDRTVGTGNTLYVFDKTFNLGEFKSRKEYLMFEKIISFEVAELTK